MSQNFFSLTPDRVLAAVERSGHHTTGLCYPLNSLENRVYEAADCPRELDQLLEGYGQFRELDRRTLGLIEVLRGLLYVRYAAWVARRWDDPCFPRAFPDWGTDRYWEGQVADLHEQLAVLAALDSAN